LFTGGVQAGAASRIATLLKRQREGCAGYWPPGRRLSRSKIEVLKPAIGRCAGRKAAPAFVESPVMINLTPVDGLAALPLGRRRSTASPPRYEVERAAGM